MFRGALYENIKGQSSIVNQLKFFVKSEFIRRDNTKTLCSDCGTIRRLLIASITRQKRASKIIYILRMW
jgi:tRNA(Ile)-lysidine synthase TilS/MesJ